MPKRNRAPITIETSSEERLMPEIRARLAKKLSHQGLRVSEIAQVLKVTQPAVTQYLKGRRGVALPGTSSIDILLDPLAEKLAQRSENGLGVETAELLETARQIIVMNTGRGIITKEREPHLGKLMELLGGRLRLELDAAEKYLELANRASDNYTKLLLRMIAADSIRHGDVISQLMSWLETGGGVEGSVPDEALLKSMLSLEDSANEASLSKEVAVDHPVARLLLRWIDIDEGKHEKMVSGLVSLSRQRKKIIQKKPALSN